MAYALSQSKLLPYRRTLRHLLSILAVLVLTQLTRFESEMVLRRSGDKFTLSFNGDFGEATIQGAVLTGVLLRLQNSAWGEAGLKAFSVRTGDRIIRQIDSGP